MRGFRTLVARPAVTLYRCLAERGQDLVEYALVFPLVLTLMLGIVEFGRVIFTYDTIWPTPPARAPATPAST